MRIDFRFYLPERMVERTARGRLFHEDGPMDCKGFRLSRRVPDVGNKEVQPVIGSKRMEGNGREWMKNEIREIPWS